MRLRHNKKRNTAFLYEMLVRHYAIASLKKDRETAKRIKKVIKEYFSINKPLHGEMSLYKNLYELERADSYTAHFLIQESKREYNTLNKKEIFNEQTKLINWINKNLGRDSFNVFVPSYKTLATISQIFNQDGNPRERVLLEKKLMASLMSTPVEKKEVDMQPMDQLVYKTVIKNFNSKYDDQLLDEQKELIQRYTISFSDGGFGFLSYLNEEISRIKILVEKNKNNDPSMQDKLQSVLQLIETFSKEPMNDRIIKKVLKLQSLVRELEDDGDNS